MQYKFTLLKDLSNYPAGTVFRYFKGKSQLLGSFKELELMGIDRLASPLCIPQEVIDNPSWIKKEIDFDSLVDLKCPVCGETRGEVSVHLYRRGNPDEGYSNCADVYFEYACGHEIRKLW